MNQQLFSVLLLSLGTMHAQAQNQQHTTQEAKSMELQKSVVFELIAENAEQVISAFPGILIIDCYADWCQPCKNLKPIFEEVANEYQAKYGFAKMNIDQCQEAAKKLRIMTLPTIVVMSGGKVVDRIIGMQSKKSLIDKIETALSLPQDLSLLDQATLNDKLFQALQGMAPLDEIKRLIDAGADVNATSPQGLTPLFLVVATLLPMGFDVTSAVELLLECGASTEVKAQNQTVQISQYLEAFIERNKMMQRNCEKLLPLLQQVPQGGCTEDSCTL